MCGISGFVGDLNLIDKNKFIEESKQILARRGPDNFNSFERDNVILCHSRLKIIDLSDSSNQPLNSESGKSTLVFNGEIYNFKELGSKIGIENPSSDSQVLIALLEKYGPDQTLPLLNGMFAFAYVNWEDKNVFLARDRFGQKPLYYSTKNGISFSSDIRVFKANHHDLTLNKNTINYYLSELSSPQPYTIWNEISQLEPAHYIQLKINESEVSKQQYWTLPAKANNNLDEEKVIDQTKEKLFKAIERRTISDVPLGYFLSGGIDSGLITSLMATNSSTQINTFTVAFSEEDFDESEDAKRLAKKYNTNHHEIRVKPTLAEDIQEIVDELGEPFADSSAIPTFYISKEIKKDVTVAISGDGGDEMFGGYIDYGYAYQAEKLLSKHDSSFKRNISVGVSKVLSRFSDRIENFGTGEEYLKIPKNLRLYRGMGFFPEDEFIEEYFQKQFNKIDSGSMTTDLMYASLYTRLLNDYLVKIDRMSMANSLEVRSPFLDFELAEFAFDIPNHLKFKDGQNKYILKKIAEEYFGYDVLSRKKKGFEIPLKHWFRKELKEFTKSTIERFDKRNITSVKGINLYNEHISSKKDHSHKIWALVCLELWLQKNH